MENDLETVSYDAVCQLSHFDFVATAIQSLGGRHNYTGLGLGLGNAPLKTALSSPEKAIGALMKIRAFFLNFLPYFMGLKRV